MKSGTLDDHPGLQRRRLCAAAGCGVALDAGIRLGDGELNRAWRLGARGALVDEEKIHIRVGRDPAKGVRNDRVRDLHLLVGRVVHDTPASPES